MCYPCALDCKFQKNLIEATLNKCFPNFNVHASHMGIPLKCNFWFKVWVDPEILNFYRHPCDADTPGLGLTL